MILFTADWHIKLGQKNVPKDWALERYYDFFSQVRELEEQVSLHIIGGDIFDRVPTLEEIQLYFDFVMGVTIPTFIFDGNHEATKKNSTFLSFLSEASSMVNPLVQIYTQSQEFDDFCILPYCDLHKKGSIEAMNYNKPLFTHVRGEIPPHVTPEVDLARFEPFPVVFAGDLHSHDNCQGNIVYPGSPMTTSFHRSKVQTGAIVIRDDWEWWWQPFNLPQLIRRTVKDPKKMVPGDYDHIIYELEGDLDDLAKVKNSELLDKKVIKRNSDTALMLGKDMSIQEELSEYLLYILELSDDKVKSIISVFNDCIKQA